MEPMLATDPKSTIGLAPPSLKFEPWIVTLPRGIWDPDVGETEVMLGAAPGA